MWELIFAREVEGQVISEAKEFETRSLSSIFVYSVSSFSSKSYSSSNSYSYSSIMSISDSKAGG